MNVFLRGNRDFCKSADRHELAGLGIDDETADSDILWNQRMVADRIDGLTHRILYCIKNGDVKMISLGKMKEQSGACCWRVVI